MILMIDNYDSFTYNLVQYLGELGEELQVFRNDKISIKEIETKKYFDSIFSHFDGINFKLNIESSTFHTDSDIFDHIIYNLIENSIKFQSSDDLQITLTILKEDHLTKIIYEDNGEGIEDELKDVLFTSFKKSENSNGLGLGLNIVKNAVQKLSGEVQLVSTPKGAKFIIILSNLNTV